MRKLIPRLDPGAAATRLAEIEGALSQGAQPEELVVSWLVTAVPNPTGGEAASQEVVQGWRDGVMDRMDALRAGTKVENDRHSARLGEAIGSVIDPIRADAGHDGVWAFLALAVFPDVVFARWPGDVIDGRRKLDENRWIGRQLGRDRNYVKLAWRRWSLLGPVIATAEPPLGEDEFVALLERTSVSRNARLVRAAARSIVDHSTDSQGAARATYARSLMKEVCIQTGPRCLDVLSDEELDEVVAAAADRVVASAPPRRALASAD